MTEWHEQNFAGLDPIPPYSQLKQSKNLRNIIKREDVNLLNPTLCTKNRSYSKRKKNDSFDKAIDVEMVQGPKNQMIPISVCVINCYGYPLLQTYVIPSVQVVNWNTQVTGLTQKKWNKMQKRNHPFMSVSELDNKLNEIFEPGDVVIGHGVAHDIKALNLKTSQYVVIDTQKLKRFRKDGLPKLPGLSRVVLRYFNLSIQRGVHNPVEDARASMLLYRTFRAEYCEQNNLMVCNWKFVFSHRVIIAEPGMWTLNP